MSLVLVTQLDLCLKLAMFLMELVTAKTVLEGDSAINAKRTFMEILKLNVSLVTAMLKILPLSNATMSLANVFVNQV